MRSDVSPVARTLLTLELLQSDPGITANRLAAKLGVSERAVRRHVEILREAGIPIESVRGRYGGYRVGRGLRLPPLMFTDAEALGLIMAVLDGHHDVRDESDPVSSACNKIVRALPAQIAAQVDAVRRSTAPAPDRSAARPDQQTTTALVRACSLHRRVRISYRSEAGTQSRTEVEPWSVVVRHGRWYLLCRSVDRDAVRAYRVDRVREVELLDADFTPPSDLDPVGMLEDHLAVGWEYQIEVVVDAPVEDAIRYLPRSLGRWEPLGTERCRLVGSTSNPIWYAEQLALIPVCYRIVACPELREAARDVARRMLAAAEAEPSPAIRRL